MTRVFPGIIIILSAGASIFYAINGDLRRSVYWAAAAVLNLSVTIN